ncbi:MAG: hypothetical protein ACC700_12775 [Anaerolineales bacterium]
MDTDRQRVIGTLADRVHDLFKELKARGIREERDLWFLHSESPRDRSNPAALQFASILADIRALNSANLSERLIITDLVYGLIWIALSFPRESENIATEALERIERLASYQATRTVDIPIENLDLGEAEFTIGPVAFLPMTEMDRADRWWERISGYIGRDASFHVVSFVRVEGPGDSETSVAHAISAAEKALIILRAIGFPFTTRPVPQIGILTDYPLSPGRPLRLGTPRENIRIGGYTDNVTLLGPPTAPYRLHEDLLAHTELDTLESLLSVVKENFTNPVSDLKAKFLAGLLWLGRATAPDIPEASIAKLTFALESFIGGDPNDEYLSSRGVTATLAERSAFLAGSDAGRRREIHRAVTDLYRLRSDIVHGRVATVSDQDLPRYGDLVRVIAWSLLRRLSEMTNVDQLQKWVVHNRYA